MENNFDNLNRLIESLKNASLFTRIFSWSKIKNQIIDAAGDVQRSILITETNKEQIAKLEAAAVGNTKDLQIANESILQKEGHIERLNNSYQELSGKLEKLTSDNGSFQASIKSGEERISQLNSDNRLLNEKNEHLSTANKGLSELTARNDQTITDLTQRTNESSSDNRSLTEKNQQLIADNKRLSESSAKNEQDILNLTARKNELDVELAEIKKDIQTTQQNLQETAEKLSSISEEHATIIATAEGHKERFIGIDNVNKITTEKNSQLIVENKRLSENAATDTQNLAELNKRKGELEIELSASKKELQLTQSELSEVKKQNIQLHSEDEHRKKEHSNSIASLSKLQDQVQADRNKELEDRNTQELERIKNLKETWNRHEENVKVFLKSVCQKNIIEYVEKVPFKGSPDNTLKICEEYVVFDAKSPGGDELHNFQGYLAQQAEKASKYSKQENVKTDVFFVVPSNTLEILKTYVYKFGEHNVYIVSIDTLEPVILSLKKIEEYEFVDQLSPEDRENICRVLGRFAHLSKRRIQVDSFFAKQFIELAYKCETLPTDVLKSVKEFERSEKLNPPMEKRTKAIPTAEVETEFKSVNNAADGHGILLQNDAMSELLSELPLYKPSTE
jgi:hypothetical protein